MIDEKRLYQALGRHLRVLREQHGQAAGRMTQAQLADRIGMERTSITNIEKGNQKVPLHVLFRICEVLGVEPSSALPALTDVQANASEVRSLSFAGRTYDASPKVVEAVAALMAGIDDDSKTYE